MIIRWLGCYGCQGTLEEALRYEFEAAKKAACAEKLQNGRSGVPEWSRVGLLCKNSAVVRRFKEDVYSVRNEQGYLRKTRKGCGGFGTHTELWVLPQYCGIVVRGKWASISRNAQADVLAASKKYGCPVFVLSKTGQLNKLS